MTEQETPLQIQTQPMAISMGELADIRELVYAQCGIALSDAKRSMVAARLGKRVRALGLGTFREYLNFVCTPKGRDEELAMLIDSITTNTTEFFREPKHFDFLTNKALPQILQSREPKWHRRVNIWSAGCSSGQEPYTLGMVLSNYFEQEDGSFSILATDISTRMLRRAKQAVYDEEDIRAVPLPLRRKYLMRGIGEQAGRYRVAPEIRNLISFSWLNLMDEIRSLPGNMDIIFCRNVIIYFDFETKAELIRKFYQCLVPGGYLFLGHSETLNRLNDQFTLVAPTVYRKPESYRTD